jgi:hypothetical protein
MPVTSVSWADAMAFAEYYGCHIPTEQEWEAACRGPKGEIWPEGGAAMDPLGHAWKGFNVELLLAQEKAKKEIGAATKRAAEAKGAAFEEADRALKKLQWILAAREVPQDPLFTIVGYFPYGTSPCGAMDMIGNIQEWVSTRLYRYPGSDGKSKWADADACVLRGGNTIDRDSLLTATFRCFVTQDTLLMAHMKFLSAGFRVARYETPGASTASPIGLALKGVVPSILPREEEKGTRRIVGPDLDPYRATGIERYDEVSWTAAGSPKNDPAGKVFLLGPAQSLSVLPATGIPFRDPSAIREAAMRGALPPAGTAKEDKRQPRDIPFLGAIHMTHGIEVKGDKRFEEWVDVPTTEKERKDALEAWKKAKAEKEKREKDAKDDPPKEDGGAKDPPPPEKNKMEGKTGGKGGKGGDKGGKPGDKPPEDSPPEDPNAPDDPTKPDEPDKPNIPLTKKEKRIRHEKGFVSGAEYTDGLLLGFLRIGDENHAALWEPRIGAVGSTAPGGTVLLEPPLVILPKDAIDFKKVGKAGAPYSSLEPTTGM